MYKPKIIKEITIFPNLLLVNNLAKIISKLLSKKIDYINFRLYMINYKGYVMLL